MRRQLAINMKFCC